LIAGFFPGWKKKSKANASPKFSLKSHLFKSGLNRDWLLGIRYAQCD
jgi:hypothetical protein